MSEITNSPWGLAAGGALAGLALGVLISNAIMDRKVTEGVERAMAAAQGEGNDAMEALAAQLAGIESAIGDQQTALSGVAEDVAARVADSSASLSDELGAVFEDQRAAISEALAGLPLIGSGDDTSSSDETAAAASAPASDAMTFGVGQTAIFADGAVRAFVSRVDAEGQMARLSINGETSDLSAGQAATVSLGEGTCLVGVTSISADSAGISSDCGVPAGEASAASSTATEGAGSVAEGEGFRVGQTASLADGALRVFVSGVVGGDARLAMNGTDTQMVGVGEPVEVTSGDETCTVTVTGIEGSTVGLQGECG